MFLCGLSIQLLTLEKLFMKTLSTVLSSFSPFLISRETLLQPITIPLLPYRYLWYQEADTAMEKIESDVEIELTGNCLPVYLSRGSIKNHRADTAGHGSKMTLSLNDYSNLVSKRILLNLLAPSSKDRTYGFLEPHTAAMCPWNFGIHWK